MNTEDFACVLNGMNLVGGPVESHEDANKRTTAEEFQKIYSTAREWVAANPDLCRMHEIAIEDYIASRHAVLELGLFSAGFALGAQAVEKLLKCYLLLAGDSLEDVWKKYSHKIVALLDKAQETSGQKDLENFRAFCQELEKWYNARYPGAGDSATQWMRAAVPHLDNLVCYLEEFMPLPPHLAHLRCGGGDGGIEWYSLFVRLFSATAGQHKFALLNENEVLSRRLIELEKRFRTDRLMAALPAATAAELADHISRTDAAVRKFASVATHTPSCQQ